MEEIRKKVEKAHQDVLDGKITLLEFQLVPLFDELKNSLSVSTLDESSKIYIDACKLLDQKFKELKTLLTSLDEERHFAEYLKSQPGEREIAELFEGCWLQPFNLALLSYRFLEESKTKLIQTIPTSYVIQHLKKEQINEDFILKLPKHKFTEKMMKFYDEIKNKLPCKFHEVFEDIPTQIKIYESFVYVLHLLQTKKLQYQPETDTLYIS